MEQTNLEINSWYFPDENYQAPENPVLGQGGFCLDDGLYSSTNLLRALEYAPGPILYRVRLHGTVVGSNRHKYRTYFFGGDVTNVLIRFARKQALIHRDLLDQLFSDVGHKSIMAWLVDGKSEFREVAQHIAHGRGDILAKRHYNAASAAVYAVYWSTKDPLQAAILAARNASRATAWRTVSRDGFGADVDRLHKLESDAMARANEMLEQMVIREFRAKKENQPMGNTNHMTRKEKLDTISNFMYREWIETIDNLLAQRNWAPQSFSTLDNITHMSHIKKRAAYITVESTGRPEELGKDFVDTLSGKEWAAIYSDAYDCLAGTVYDYVRWISRKAVLDSSYLSRYFDLSNIDDCDNLVSILQDSDQSDIVEKAEQVIWESAKNRHLKHVYPDALVGSLGLSDAEAEKSILNAVYKVLEDEEDDEPYIL